MLFYRKNLLVLLVLLSVIVVSKYLQIDHCNEMTETLQITTRTHQVKQKLIYLQKKNKIEKNDD